MVLFNKKALRLFTDRSNLKVVHFGPAKVGHFRPASYGHFNPARVVYYVRRFHPRLNYKISEYEKYKEHLQKKSDIEMLAFLSELERKIGWCKTNIERERKDEFLKDWGI